QPLFRNQPQNPLKVAFPLSVFQLPSAARPSPHFPYPLIYYTCMARSQSKGPPLNYVRDLV
ncbi:MAG: hypothetical protein ABIL62_14860, partial [Planctomycetota bacterium]